MRWFYFICFVWWILACTIMWWELVATTSVVFSGLCQMTFSNEHSSWFPCTKFTQKWKLYLILYWAFVLVGLWGGYMTMSIYPDLLALVFTCLPVKYLLPLPPLFNAFHCHFPNCKKSYSFFQRGFVELGRQSTLIHTNSTNLRFMVCTWIPPAK